MNFYVSDWYVDVDANQIISSQQSVKLESKVMALLVFLAKHPNDVISRQQIETEIWKNQVTSYDALTSCLRRLRKALGDNSRNPQYIETVTKKGYRLVAPVRWENKAENVLAYPEISPRAYSKKFFSIIIITTLLISAMAIYFLASRDDQPISSTQQSTPAIIVQPFETLGEDPKQTYFSQGITTDIQIALSKVSGLQVVAIPTDTQQKQHSDYSLIGSVQRAKNKLRVNVRLLDNKTYHQLWAESYDREITEIFDVQDDIAARVVSALSIKLSQEEKKRIAHRYTKSIEAYDLFLQGQANYIQRTSNSNLTARQLFQRAIEIDPAFARAYSAQSLTYTSSYRYGWSNKINPLHTAVSLAEKAISIDNELPEAHWVLSYARVHMRQYDLAITEARKSLELRPGYSDALATLAISYIYKGDEIRGIDILESAIRSNPYYPAPYAASLGQAYYHIGQYEKALSVLQDAMQRNYSLLTSHVMYVATLHRLEIDEEAEWAVDQLYGLAPNFTLKDVSRIFPIQNGKKILNIVNDLRDAGIK